MIFFSVPQQRPTDTFLDTTVKLGLWLLYCLDTLILTIGAVAYAPMVLMAAGGIGADLGKDPKAGPLPIMNLNEPTPSEAAEEHRPEGAQGFTQQRDTGSDEDGDADHHKGNGNHERDGGTTSREKLTWNELLEKLQQLKAEFYEIKHAAEGATNDYKPQ